MRKSIKIIAITGLVASSLMFVGCKSADTIKTVVENAYTVVKGCDQVITVITTKLSGSDLWADISKYIGSLDTALNAIEVTLEKVAPLVGANLTTLSSVTPANSTAELDAASAKLLKSIE